jgi:hypothetical protein
MDDSLVRVAGDIPPDTLIILLKNLQVTMASMYVALLNAEPVISEQIVLIAKLRLLGSILLFICFAVVLVVFVWSRMKAQKVKKIIEVRIMSKEIIAILAVFVLSLGLWNTLPGYFTYLVDKRVKEKVTVEYAKNRLFGGDGSILDSLRVLRSQTVPEKKNE